MTSSQSVRTDIIKSEEDDQCGKDAEEQNSCTLFMGIQMDTGSKEDSMEVIPER
jgi:hypothetical protein